MAAVESSPPGGPASTAVPRVSGQLSAPASGHALRRQKGTGRGIHGHCRPLRRSPHEAPRIRTAAAHPESLDVPAAGLRGPAAVRDADDLPGAAGAAHHRLLRCGRRGRRRRRCLHGAARPAGGQARRPLRAARGPRTGRPAALGGGRPPHRAGPDRRPAVDALRGGGPHRRLGAADRADGPLAVGGPPRRHPARGDGRRLRVGHRRADLRPRPGDRHGALHRRPPGRPASPPKAPSPFSAASSSPPSAPPSPRSPRARPRAPRPPEPPAPPSPSPASASSPSPSSASARSSAASRSP